MLALNTIDFCESEFVNLAKNQWFSIIVLSAEERDKKKNGLRIVKVKMVKFALWKLKWSNSPLKPLLMFANLRIQEDGTLRPSAIALKTSTGCVQHFRLTCSFAGGLRPTFFSACRNSLLPSASSFSSVMVTSGSGCHFSLSLKIKKMNVI